MKFNASGKLDFKGTLQEFKDYGAVDAAMTFEELLQKLQQHHIIASHDPNDWVRWNNIGREESMGGWVEKTALANISDFHYIAPGAIICGTPAIENGAPIYNGCIIAENASIGHQTLVYNSVVRGNASVGSGSVIENCELGGKVSLKGFFSDQKLYGKGDLYSEYHTNSNVIFRDEVVGTPPYPVEKAKEKPKPWDTQAYKELCVDKAFEGFDVEDRIEKNTLGGNRKTITYTRNGVIDSPRQDDGTWVPAVQKISDGGVRREYYVNGLNVHPEGSAHPAIEVRHFNRPETDGSEIYHDEAGKWLGVRSNDSANGLRIVQEKINGGSRTTVYYAQDGTKREWHYDDRARLHDPEDEFGSPTGVPAHAIYNANGDLVAGQRAHHYNEYDPSQVPEPIRVYHDGVVVTEPSVNGAEPIRWSSRGRIQSSGNLGGGLG